MLKGVYLNQHQEPLEMNQAASISQLTQMMQSFIDEHCVDRVKVLLSPQMNLGEKMEVMDWLVRYIDFLSGKAIFECIEAFKSIFNVENETLKVAYIYAKTNTTVAKTVVE